MSNNKSVVLRPSSRSTFNQPRTGLGNNDTSIWVSFTLDLRFALAFARVVVRVVRRAGITVVAGIAREVARTVALHRIRVVVAGVPDATSNRRLTLACARVVVRVVRRAGITVVARIAREVARTVALHRIRVVVAGVRVDARRREQSQTRPRIRTRRCTRRSTCWHHRRRRDRQGSSTNRRSPPHQGCSCRRSG